MSKPLPSEITPEHVYLDRRRFLTAMGGLAAGAILGACTRTDAEPTPETVNTVTPGSGWEINEVDDPLTSYESITSYNNFYEFSLDKDAVRDLVSGFVTSPWEVEVGGLVREPRTFGLEDLLQFEI